MTKPSKVGVLLYNGYQELEFWYPVLRLREAGIEVAVIGVDGGEVASSLLGYPVVPNVALSATAPWRIRRPRPSRREGVGGRGEWDRCAASSPTRRAAAAILAAASQAVSLLPDGKGLIARTTDDVPQWTRALLNALQRSPA